MIEALTSLFDNRNLGLNSSIIEVLERLGEIELDNPDLDPGILETISSLVVDPDNSERWPEAYGIFGSQFDGPYSETYYRIVQGLPDSQRKALFNMAAKGADYAGLFLSVLLLDLAAFNDPHTAPAFQRWALPPPHDAFMPQQAAEAFTLANVALARLRVAYRPIDSDNVAEEAFLACGQILYWGNCVDVTEEIKGPALRQAWSTLRSADVHPYALNVIADCSNLMIRSTDKLPGGKATLSIAKLCPEEAAVICRTGLESPEALAGYFQYYDRRRDLNFALQLLSKHGGSSDLLLLRKYAQSSELSRSALDGIRYLEGQLHNSQRQ